jgi:hypothetical protein
MRTGRLPFVILAMLSLITGLLAGLHRIGWTLPLGEVSPNHGAIMVGGFLGTLITLEKIIPLKRNILYVFFQFISGCERCIVLYWRTSIFCSLFDNIASAGLSIVFLIYLGPRTINDLFIDVCRCCMLVNWKHPPDHLIIFIRSPFPGGWPLSCSSLLRNGWS